MCKRQQEYIKLIFRVLFWYTTPLPLTFFRSLFRSHIASEVLTYCHAPVHSCSWLIPSEERALTIRGFSALHRPTRRCKVFWSMDQPKDPPPCPSTREGSSYNCVTPSPTFYPWDRREYPAGGRGWINSLRTLVVTKFATPSAPAWNKKVNKNFALFAFFAWKTKSLLFLISRKGRRNPKQTALPLE